MMRRGLAVTPSILGWLVIAASLLLPTSALAQSISFGSVINRTLTIAPGGSGQVDIGITRNAYTGTLNVAVMSTLPFGVQVSYTQPGTSSSGAVRFSVASNAALVTGHSVRIRVSGTGVTAIETTAALTVAYPPGLSSLSATPNSITVAPGSSGSLPVNFTRVGGFTGSVSLSTVGGVPPGVTPSFTQPGTGTSGVVTFAVSTATATGMFPIRVRASGSGVQSVETSVTLVVSYRECIVGLSAARSSVTIAPGATGEVGVTFSRASGCAGAVNLAPISTLPPGVSISFGQPGTANSGTVRLSVASTAGTGSFPVRVQASGTGMAPAESSFTLVIQEPACAQNVSASPNPATLAPGSSVNVNVSFSRAAGCTSSLSLAVPSTLPSGVTASVTLEPGGANSGTVRFTAPTGTATGSFNVRLQVNGPNVRAAETSLSLNVQQPTCLLSASATPDPLTVIPGGSGLLTVGVSRASGCTAPVSLSVVSGVPAGVSASVETQPGNGSSGTIRFAAASSAAIGTSPIRVRAQATGTQAVETSVQLSTQYPSCIENLAATPDSVVIVPGSSRTVSVGFTRAAGCTASVGLDVISTLPVGVTAATNPPGAGSTGSITLTAGSATQLLSGVAVRVRASALGIASAETTFRLSSSCTYDLSRTTVSAIVAGQTAQIAVATQQACTWTATETSSWISIDSGASGVGSGNVTISVDPNPTGSPRSADVLVAGTPVTVSQSFCQISFEPVGASLGAQAGAGAVRVVAASGCPWSISSDSSWFQITGAATGTGSGVVNYTNDAFSGTLPRVGRISGSGGTFTVTQSPATAQTVSLTITLSPPEAVQAGARWRVDGGVWRETGATVPGLEAGSSHVLEYLAVPGWIEPPAETAAPVASTSLVRTLRLATSNLVASLFGQPVNRTYCRATLFGTEYFVYEFRKPGSSVSTFLPFVGAPEATEENLRLVDPGIGRLVMTKCAIHQTPELALALALEKAEFLYDETHWYDPRTWSASNVLRVTLFNALYGKGIQLFERLIDPAEMVKAVTEGGTSFWSLFGPDQIALIANLASTDYPPEKLLQEVQALVATYNAYGGDLSVFDNLLQSLELSQARIEDWVKLVLAVSERCSTGACAASWAEIAAAFLRGDLDTYDDSLTRVHDAFARPRPVFGQVEELLETRWRSSGEWLQLVAYLSDAHAEAALVVARNLRRMREAIAAIESAEPSDENQRQLHLLYLRYAMEAGELLPDLIAEDAKVMFEQFRRLREHDSAAADELGVTEARIEELRAEYDTRRTELGAYVRFVERRDRMTAPFGAVLIQLRNEGATEALLLEPTGGGRVYVDPMAARASVIELRATNTSASPIAVVDIQGASGLECVEVSSKSRPTLDAGSSAELSLEVSIPSQWFTFGGSCQPSSQAQGDAFEISVSVTWRSGASTLVKTVWIPISVAPIGRIATVRADRRIYRSGERATVRVTTEGVEATNPIVAGWLVRPDGTAGGGLSVGASGVAFDLGAGPYGPYGLKMLVRQAGTGGQVAIPHTVAPEVFYLLPLVSGNLSALNLNGLRILHRAADRDTAETLRATFGLPGSALFEFDDATPPSQLLSVATSSDTLLIGGPLVNPLVAALGQQARLSANVSRAGDAIADVITAAFGSRTAAVVAGYRLADTIVAGMALSHAARCSIRLSSLASGLLAAGGGAGGVNVATAAECRWSAVTSDAWIRVTSGATGAGPGAVSFSVDAYSGSDARMGSISIGAQRFSVTQAGTGACTVSLPATSSGLLQADGASGSFQVQAPSGCTWAPTSSDPAWIQITSQLHGPGNGTVGFRVAANQSPVVRRGAVVVGGRTYDVAQAAAPCSYTLDPLAGTPLLAAGGAGGFELRTTAGCSWTAASNVPWLRLTTDASGDGSTTMGFVADPNPEVQPRTGTISVASRAFSVHQDGSSICSVVLDPVSNPTVPAGGASGGFAVQTSAGCSWTATSTTPDWLRIVSPTPQVTVAWALSASVGTPPLARNQVTSQYDPASDRLIVSGGNSYGALQNDVWVLTNATQPGGSSTWTRLVPQGANLPVRQAHVSGYDARTNRLVIHGGWPGLADTWLLTNANGTGGQSTWTRLPDGPVDRTGASAAYDPATSRLIVYGGLDVDYYTVQGWHNDVWVLNGANGEGPASWVQLQPTGTPPPPRYYAGTAYDPHSNRLIVFGGSGQAGALGDLWVLTNANGEGGVPAWVSFSAAGPGPRAGHHLGYDPIFKRAILVAGDNSSGARPSDVWILDHADGTAGAPAWRAVTQGTGDFGGNSVAAFGYAAASGRAVLALGVVGGNYRDDVWTAQLSTGAVDGTGTVTYAAAENRSPSSRSGAIVVGRQTHEVTQAGTPQQTRAIVLSGLLQYGPVAVGATAQRTLTIRNTGNAPLTVSGINYPPGFSGPWSGQLLPDTTRDVLVTFAPTSVQDYQGEISVLANHTHGEPVIVASGSGVPPCSISLNPTSAPAFPGSGASGSFAVQAPPGCGWTAISNAPSWLRIVDPPVSGYQVSWATATSSGAPPLARNQVTSQYDVPSDRLIISGGNHYGNLQNDVWVLSGATRSTTPVWSRVSPQGTPPPVRQGHVSGYDPSTNRMVIHGGWPGLADTWVLTNATGLGGGSEWIRLPDAPLDRTGAAAVYDSVSNRLIVYGGTDVDYYTLQGWHSDVWVLQDANGVGAPSWMPLQPVGAPPPPRYYAGAAYDPNSNRLIIYGGAGPSSVLSDMWVLTNANGLGGTPEWIQHQVAGPGPRAGHHLGYDAANRRAVLVGGDGASGRPTDLWVLENADGSGGSPTWRLAGTTGDFGGNSVPAFAFEPGTGRVTLALGVRGGEYRDDVWSGALSAASAGTGPGTVRYSVALNTTPQPRIATIAVGGSNHTVPQDAGPPASRVITLSGDLDFGEVAIGQTGVRTFTVGNAGTDVLTVTDITAPAGFSVTPRALRLMPGQSRFVSVVFAPTAQGPHTGQVTVFADSTAGSNTILARGTGAVTGCIFAINPPTSGTLPGSGAQVSFSLGTAATCTWSAVASDPWIRVTSPPPGTRTTWEQLSPAGQVPLARNQVTSQYDLSTDRLIISGGNHYGTLQDDVWVLADATQQGSAANWTRLTPQGPVPAARQGHVSGYDAATNRLVIHGGWPGLADTWVLTNANGLGGTPQWIPMPSASLDRTGASAAYDAGSNRLIVFGGLDVDYYTTQGWFNDVWVLRDANGIGTPQWQQLQPTATPPAPRYYAGTAYDPTSNRLILVGGAGQGGYLGDVWVLTNANGLGGTPAWISYPAVGPEARSGQHLAYDPATKRAVMVAGSVASAPALTRTVWVLENADGTTGAPAWRQVTNSGADFGGNSVAGFGYSSSSGTVVLALGAVGTGYRNDVWAARLTAAAPSGTGPGVIGYTVDANPGSGGRSGSITVEGQVHTVTQAGAGGETRVIGLSGNLAFGSTAVGTTASRALTISNAGSSPLLVTGITYPAGYSGNWTSGTVPAGGTQPVTVTFAPTAAIAYNGTITVQANHTGGTPAIAVSGTGTLITAGSIEGQVRNALTDLPQSDVRVWALTAGTWNVAGVADTTIFGGYVISGLAPGNYVLHTTNNLGLVDEVFNNIPCPTTPCDVTLATSVPVTAGATTAGRNFFLDPGGRVTGRVTDSGTGAPVPGVSVSLYAAHASGPRFVRGATSNASGDYAVEGLATGQYFAFTNNTAGYTNEIFDNLLCPGVCAPSVAAASGTPIPVTVNSTTSGRNFTLDRGGAMSGVVTDAATGAPLAGIGVTAVTRLGSRAVEAGGAQTNAAGVFTIRGLPDGSYEAYVDGADGYVGKIFGGPACVGRCRDVIQTTPGTVTPVTAGSTADGISFSLERGGRITGVVMDTASGLPLPNVEVEVMALVGGTVSQVDSVLTNAFGVYETRRGLATGSYIAGAFNNLGYMQELFDNVVCVEGADCLAAVPRATPIPVSAGATTTGRSFALSLGGTLTGRVADAATGAPLAGVEVWLYKHTPAGGVRVGERGRVTDATGTYTFRSLVTGMYVAFTSNSHGYADEVFSDVSCEAACSSEVALLLGNAIPVTAGGQTSGIDFGLRRRAEPGAPANLRAVVLGFSVAFTWDAPSAATGGVASSYVLEAGLSPGTTFVTVPTPTASFTAPGVPAGRYYVRVRAVNGSGTGPASSEIVLEVGTDGAAPLEPPRNAVAFMSGGRLTLTWEAPATGGTASGYVVEAGSAAGLANIASLPVTGTSFSFDLVPPGYYFLRVRARSATGTSAPSNEVMIAVGGAPSPPSAPLTFQAVVTGSTVTFQWTAPIAGPTTGYRLEAGTGPGLSNIAVLNTGSAGTSISFSGVPPGRYYVRLRGVNGLGAGVPSNEIVLDVR